MTQELETTVEETVDETELSSEEVSEETSSPNGIDPTPNYDPTSEVRQNLLGELQVIVAKLSRKEGKLNRRDLVRAFQKSVNLNFIQDRLISHILGTLWQMMMNITQESMRHHNVHTYIGAISELLVEKGALTEEEINEKHKKRFLESAPEEMKKHMLDATQKTEDDTSETQTDLPDSTESSEDLPSPQE